ncbi:hypothetical protein BCR42DRAFT_435227 [Absidia repens]|uniref:Uncharacterized protein n=1 Tax=Absidia repens TaxID=90262 RepID=A0A1X2IMW1_9FUNG|nr:hypothetical protein BCR42DRAFT_435227 [Absidia repens]
MGTGITTDDVCGQRKKWDGNQALKLISESFHGLAWKRRNHLPLALYCNDLTDFLKKKTVKEKFLRIYDTKYLEKTAHQIGHKNGVLLSISGANCFKNKLESLLDNSDEKISASPSSSSTPVNQWLGKAADRS